MIEVERIEYKDHTIVINADDMAEDPREWDNLGTMICFHSNYKLGDDHDYTNVIDFLISTLVDLGMNHDLLDEKYYDKDITDYCLDKLSDYAVLLPLYLYDHSGITMNTTGFGCPWDSGQVGIIYITKKKIREEHNKKRISKKLRDRIINLLKGEVDTFDQYIRGEVYYYTVEDSEGESIDSCGGFYGHDWEENGLMEHAKPEIDYAVKKWNEEKTLIHLEEIGV